MDQKRSSPGAGNTEARKVSSEGTDRDLPNPPFSLKPAGLPEAEVAIEAAKAVLPRLTWAGIGVPDEFSFEVARNNFDPYRVDTAMRFLRSGLALRKRPENSGWLKHLAEGWGRDNGASRYVANGELIAAAIYLGFVVKEIPETPNAMIGFGRRR